MYIQRRFCEEAPGEGGDGGDKPKADPNAEVLKSLGDGMNALAANMKTMQDNMSAMVQKQNEAPPEVKKEPMVDPLSADLESLGRKEFADIIVKAVVGRVKEDMFTPVESRMDSLHKNVETTGLKAEMKSAQEAHPDFWDWKDEMGAKISQIPGLSVEEAYTLARSTDGDKALKLDEQYKKETPSDGDDAGGKPSGSFGGMRPGAVQSDPATDMKPDQAAEKAWEETMAELGDAI
jgi:hypothetical protein